MDRARDGPPPAAPHRVGRLRFELDGGDEAAVLRLRGALVGGAESWIPAALDTAFAALDQPGRSVHIQRLEVDLGLLPPSGVTPELLAEGVRAALVRQLRAPAPGTPAPRVIGETATLAATLRYFLQHGRLPWWSVVESVAALELSITQADTAALRDLARAGAAILASLRGARRLVLQLSPEAGARLAAALPGAPAGAFKPKDWPKPSDTEAVEALVARIRRAATATIPRKPKEQAEASKSGTETEAHTDTSDEPAFAEETAAEADTLPEPDLDNAIAVTDAGLVLLHPFLAPLFEARGLAAGGRFASEAAQQRAVHLSGYLASGETAAPEPALVMAKLLCGWPLDEPLAREGDLSADDRAEAEEVLRAVIGHWDALGKASPEALRETFLARPGRLSQDDKAWRLDVERRGTDVLIERLPWALGKLRLPWMPLPLFVNWV